MAALGAADFGTSRRADLIVIVRPLHPSFRSGAGRPPVLLFCFD